MLNVKNIMVDMVVAKKDKAVDGDQKIMEEHRPELEGKMNVRQAKDLELVELTQVVSSGGGSGWYGGGASSNCGFSTGGSGYVFNSSTAKYYPEGCLLNENFYLTESSTHAGNSSFPSPIGTSKEIGHIGHGYAKITCI